MFACPLLSMVIASKKKANNAVKQEEVPEHLVNAFQETQRKLENIQSQIDKLGTRINLEERRKKAASFALNFLDSKEAKTSLDFYMQLGKAFCRRPEADIRKELTSTVAEIEKEHPKLINAAAQFELKRKEELANIEQIGIQVKALQK
jgi:hypothetical protein